MAEHRIWTAQQVAEALGINAQGSWQAGSISIDSRTVAAGDLFVALKGEQFDGHAFVARALQAGAVAAVVTRPVEGAGADRQLVVADTEAALRDLGRYARTHTPARYIAVTGSVGKTSVKEQLKLAFSALGETFATAGNFNNHIGMPLSLARMPQSTRFGVFEMGMNHAGEITPLSQLVEPDVAIITTVEAVHLENFASEQGIADAKAEIFDGLNPNGTAVINADNRHAAYLREHLKRRNLSRVLEVGTGDGCAIRLLSAEVTAQGQRIEAEVAGRRLSYSIGSLARHQAFNTLFSLAATHALGHNVEAAAAGLSTFTDPPGRGKLHQLVIDGAVITLIDDSYNASPASMKAAIATAATVVERQGRGRLVAVLGDMLELGPEEGALHASLAPALREAGAQVLVAAGPRMKALAAAAVMAGVFQVQSVSGASEVEAALLPLLQSGDVLLVKGSHGSKMYQVAEALGRFATPMPNTNPQQKVVA